MNDVDRFIAGSILIGIGLGIFAGMLLRESLGLAATVVVALTLMGVTWAFSPSRREVDF